MEERNRKRASNEKRRRELGDEVWLARQRGYERTYRNRHPERVAEKDHATRIKSRFGLSKEEYTKHHAEQEGLCRACRTEESGFRNGRRKRLAVDHCHVCGLFRGLLCSNCNTALGLVHEDAGILRSLLSYLGHHDHGRNEE